jgi:hypothetical protein
VGGLRCAKVKSEPGSLYHELPADHWIPAWQAAIRRAECLRLDEHFQFRGGSPRPAGWYAMPERLSDPTAAELQLDRR